MSLLASVLDTFFTSPLFLLLGAVFGSWFAFRLFRFWRTAK